MDIFPLELCIVALERCRDVIDYAAAWLLEHGFAELERMNAEILAKSEREDRERQERDMMRAILEEQQALGQFVQRTPSPSLTASGSIINTPPIGKKPAQNSPMVDDIPIQQAEEADEEDSEEDGQDEEDKNDDYDYNNREPARFLDDEIGVDAPVQLERERRDAAQLAGLNANTVEEFKIEDLYPGMLLSISSSYDGTEVIETVIWNYIYLSINQPISQLFSLFVCNLTLFFNCFVSYNPCIGWTYGSSSRGGSEQYESKTQVLQCGDVFYP